MLRITRWFRRGNRAITAGTIFVLVVISALLVMPIVTSTLALRQHAHLRDVVDPFDEDLGHLAQVVAPMDSGFLRYVITGNPEDMAAYQVGAQSLRDLLPGAKARAGTLSPAAVRQMDDLEQTISHWQQFVEPIIGLRQRGLSDQAHAAVATGQGARLINDFWQEIISLHNEVGSVRASDRDQLDRILTTEAILAAFLAALGIPAAVTIFGLSRRTTRLYKEVEIERGRVEEMAESERRRADELDAIVENMAEGIVVVDPGGQILHLNLIARQMWQLPWPVAHIGRADDIARLDLRYPDDRPIPLEERPIDRALQGETFSAVEMIFVSPDGKRHHLRFGGSPVRDEAGMVVLAVVIFHDITEIRELERQREEFISVVAHDLRGMITVVRGYCALANRPSIKAGMPPQAQRAAEAVSTASGRLERMVEDLLDVSRIEARRLALNKKSIDLLVAVREAATEAAELTRGHPVRVEVKGPVPPVYADTDRLAQVLTNLLSNAAKYSYPDSEVVIEVEPRPDEVVVSVTNHGAGIAPDDIPKLFTRFHRTEMATRERVPGLGLGLYIAKGLVEAQGGRIWVESEPGKLTTFRFALPVKEKTSGMD